MSGNSHSRLCCRRRYFFPDMRRGNLQLAAAIAGADGDHAADFFDQAGEHGFKESKTHQDTEEFAGQHQML